MKKKIGLVLMVSLFSAAAIVGCGKEAAKETADEEAAVVASSEESAQQEASEAAEAVTEAATQEASASNPIVLEDAITKAMLDTNVSVYSQGEVATEGHILLDSKEDGPQTTCYLLASFAYYEFQNGNFVRSSGSGVIPTVITFTKNDAGEYIMVSYEECEDGSRMVESIKELFPEEFWSRCITTEDDDRNEIDKQIRSDAEEYLASIGRDDCEIGDFADFEYVIPTDLGISEEASNELGLAYKYADFIQYCPNFYIGNREAVEDGVRYVYACEYDEKAGKVIYSKSEYDTKEVIESMEFSAKTGKPIE